MRTRSEREQYLLSFPDEQQIGRLERRREPISLLQNALRGEFGPRLSLLSTRTLPVAGLCMRRFVVENSRREEWACTHSYTLHVLIDGWYVRCAGARIKHGR